MCTVRLCVYSMKGDKTVMRLSCVIGGQELLRQRGGGREAPLSELSEVEFPTAGQGVIHIH